MPALPLGTIIRRARQKRGLTQAALAKLAKVTQGSISNYERGVQMPTEGTLAALAECLDIPAEEFVQSEWREPTTEPSTPLRSPQQRMLETLSDLPGAALWHHAPSGLGGDVAFALPLRNQLYIVLIDGSGSGAAAAASALALSAFIWGILQSAVGVCWPAEILEQTERLPAPLGGPEQGAALVVLFDRTHRTLHHARGQGVPHPYLRNGSRTGPLPGRPSRLGRFHEGRVQDLATGSLLLLATDGVANQGRADGGPLWSSPDIKTWVSRTQSAEHLVQQVSQRVQRGRPLGSDDDMLVVAVEL